MINIESDRLSNTLQVSTDELMEKANVGILVAAVDAYILTWGKMPVLVISSIGKINWEDNLQVSQMLQAFEDEQWLIHKMAISGSIAMLTFFPPLPEFFNGVVVRQFETHEHRDALAWMQAADEPIDFVSVVNQPQTEAPLVWTANQN